MKDNSLDSSSFALARTNVALTGNIKITIDSNENIFLDTIDSDASLSKSEYKHFAIKDELTHPQNINLLFGNSAKEMINNIFIVKDDVKDNYKDYMCINNEYDKQYDFSLYYSGAKYLKASGYSEKMSYFSPLYLQEKDIPEYFVILRIDGAINDTLLNLEENKETAYTSKEYMYELLSKSTIIKTFSLKETSRIGAYIRSMINDVNYPSCPLNVNFNKGMNTVWNGISVANGVYSSGSELLDSFYSDDKPLKIFEKYFVDGYKRNGLLFPNILNLEFLFNDDTAEILSHNRYFGVYVNESNLGDMIISTSKQRERCSKFDNYPVIKNPIDPLLNKNLIINNDSGVVLFSDNDTVEADANSLFINDETHENQVIGYAKDKYDNFHMIKSASNDSNGDLDYIKLKDKSINLKDFIGSDEKTVVCDYGYIQDEYGKSFIELEFEGYPEELDKLIIYHTCGSRIDEDGNYYDEILFSNGFGELLNPIYGHAGDHYSDIRTTSNADLTVDNNEIYNYRGDSYNIEEIESTCLDVNDYTLYKGEESIEYTNSDGSLITIESGNVVYKTSITVDTTVYYILAVSDSVESMPNYHDYNVYYVGICGNEQEIYNMTSALSDCINDFPIKNFTSISYQNKIALVYMCGGDNNSRLRIGYSGNGIKNISIKGKKINDYLYESVGGATYDNTVLISNVYNDTIDISKHIIKNITGYSYLKEKSYYAGDTILRSSESLIKKVFSNIDDYIALIIDEDSAVFTKNGKIYITSEYRIPVGLLSIYNIKDFDYSFYENKYAKTHSFDNKKYYVNSDSDKLEPGYIYNIEDEGEGDFAISCDYINTCYNDDTKFFVTEECTYSVTTGTGSVSKYLYILKNDNNFDLKNTFSSKSDDTSTMNLNSDFIKNVSFVTITDNEESNSTYSTSLSNGVNNEYDYLNENYYESLAYASKMSPYICKWGYKNGYDVNGNPYRLNISDAFGKYNLSPSYTNGYIDHDSLSNDWFYLVSNQSDEDGDKFYINKKFDEDNLDFDDYFTDNVGGVLYKKYSPITYNEESKCCETFFKGMKLSFNEMKEDGSGFVENSHKYDGYKFTCLLCPKELTVSEIEDRKENIQPVKYKIIENSDEKYILYLIELYLASGSNNKLYSSDGEKIDITKHVCSNTDTITGVITTTNYNITASSGDKYVVNSKPDEIYVNGKRFPKYYEDFYLPITNVVKNSDYITGVSSTNLTKYKSNTDSKSFLYNDSYEKITNIYVGKDLWLDENDTREIYEDEDESKVILLMRAYFGFDPIKYTNEDGETENITNGYVSYSEDEVIYYTSNSEDIPDYNIENVVSGEKARIVISGLGGYEISSISANEDGVSVEFSDAVYNDSIEVGCMMTVRGIQVSGKYLSFNYDDIDEGDIISVDKIYPVTLSKYSKTISDIDSSYNHAKYLYADKTYSIYGDHRILFNENGISNLTISDLYSFKSLKYDYDNEEYGSIIIPTDLELIGETSSKHSADNLIEDYYESDLRREIQNFDYKYPFVYKSNSKNGNELMYLLPYLSVGASKYEIKGKVFDSADEYYTYSNTYNQKYGIRSYTYNDDTDTYSPTKRLSNPTTRLEQVMGGKNYFADNVFSLITFSNLIDNLTNTEKGIIGDSVLRISYSEPSIIYKTSSTESEESGNYYTYYNISKNESIYRYSGKYLPVFSNLISMKSTSNGVNTEFNSESENFGIINDFCHVKVSDSNIYRLDNDKNYILDCEMTGDIVIDHSDYNALLTSWDLDYHIKNDSLTGSYAVPGSLRIEEDDTIINNIINLPDTIELTLFNPEEVDDPYVVDMESNDFVYNINDNYINIRLNYLNNICDKLIELGISDKAFSMINVGDKYEEYLGMTYNDYIRSYIKKNIAQLYEIDYVAIARKKRTNKSVNEIGISSEDYATLTKSNFIVDKNVKINNKVDYNIDFKYSIRSDYNSIINIIIKLKLI